MYEERRGYRWKLAVRLDNSFQFLIEPAVKIVEGFSANRSTFMSWVAGLVDADGTLYLANDQRYARISFTIANENLEVLRSISRILGVLGYHTNGPYLAYSAGTTTPYGITYKNDLWRLFLQRSGEVQQLLQELPIRHSERILQKELASSLTLPTRWAEVEVQVREMRKAVEAERDEFRELAEQAYLAKRTPVHEKDRV